MYNLILGATTLIKIVIMIYFQSQVITMYDNIIYMHNIIEEMILNITKNVYSYFRI